MYLNAKSLTLFNVKKLSTRIVRNKDNSVEFVLYVKTDSVTGLTQGEEIEIRLQMDRDVDLNTTPELDDHLPMPATRNCPGCDDDVLPTQAIIQVRDRTWHSQCYNVHQELTGQIMREIASEGL